MSTLAEIAQRSVAWNETTKSIENYRVYDRYFGHLAEQPISLLELGVYQGASTKVFASFFRNGRIIAVDNADRGADFSEFPNVISEIADQRDPARLKDICRRHAPNGLDIVIDDASHVGRASLASYDALLPMLKPGGLYIVEDWGTGYWDKWPDGRAPRARRRGGFGWRRKSRIPGHDFGMVGFLKSLFEDVSVDLGPEQPPKLEYMHIYGNIAVLKKIS